jgi:hypothetical protein
MKSVFFETEMAEVVAGAETAHPRSSLFPLHCLLQQETRKEVVTQRMIRIRPWRGSGNVKGGNGSTTIMGCYDERKEEIANV